MDELEGIIEEIYKAGVLGAVVRDSKGSYHHPPDIQWVDLSPDKRREFCKRIYNALKLESPQPSTTCENCHYHVGEGICTNFLYKKERIVPGLPSFRAISMKERLTQVYGDHFVCGRFLPKGDK